MNGELNFSISTEGLGEKGVEVKKQSGIIKEALNDINDARSLLASWVSTNKDKYDNRVVSALPKMNEMTEVIDLFGDIATQTSERAQSVENKIASAIDNDFLA